MCLSYACDVLDIPVAAAAPTAAQVELQALHQRERTQATQQMKRIDGLLLLEMAPEEQVEFRDLQVPAVFERFMIQLKLGKADRVAVLRRLVEWGAQRTAHWLLEQAPRFQAAADATVATAAGTTNSLTPV